MRRSWYRFFFFLLFLCIIPKTASADTSGLFRAGTDAFNAGDYESAAQYFRQAKSEGMDSPNLYYNMGLSWFRAGHLEEAGTAFERLAEYPDWRHMAFYNLGRIEESRNNEDAASDYYRKAIDEGPDSKVAQLARSRLLASDPGLDAEPPGRGALSRWNGMAMLAAGYDHNVVLAPDDDVFEGISPESDAFADAYVYGNTWLTGNSAKGIRFDAGVYGRFYAKQSDYHFASFFTGISRYNQHPVWRTQLGFFIDVDFTGEGYYASTPSFRMALEREIGRFDLLLSNELAWIEAEDDYGYVSGVRNRTAAEITGRLQSTLVHAGYEFEYNRRDDLRIGDQFFSYSPLRNRVYALVDQSLFGDWSIRVRGEYRKSSYPDANRADGSEIRERREDDRLMFSVRPMYAVTRDLDLFAEYRHTDNDSNFSEYTYSGSQVMIGCRRSF